MSRVSSDPLIRSLRQANRRWLLAILITYLILAIGYGLATPLFEAPDEQHHYYTATAIAANRRLPTTQDASSELTGQEAAQPPLYYLLGALFVAPLDLEVDGEAFWPNPFVQLGAADSPHNINAFVHTPEESWPWPDHVLAAHLLRLLSTLIGLGTLLAIFASARLVWPAHPERALLVTALVAFLPQFAFLHGAISNDTLIIFLCAAAIWQLLRMWYGEVSWRRLLLLGITTGLAILSKTAGLLLLLYALGFVTLIVWREQRDQSPGKKVRQVMLALLAIGVPALILAGWLLWRNWQLYGDITASNQFVQLAGGDRGYSLPQVLKESRGLWTSFFAVFGWFNVLAPRWVYLIWNVIVGASIVGATSHWWRRRRGGREANGRDGDGRDSEQPPPAESVSFLDRPGAPAVLLALWLAMLYAGLVFFMLRTPASQGRLLFPALVPLALALAYGLSGYRWSGVFLLAPVLALLTSIYCLLFVIPGAYQPPAAITLEDVPAGIQQIDVDLGQGVRLLASQMETEQAQAGDLVWLTLYWQAAGSPGAQPAQDAPAVVLELFGRDDELLGKQQSYHGGGLYPSSLWSAGDVLADRLAVELGRDLQLPVQARLNVKLAAEERSVDAGTVKIIPESWPEPSENVLAGLNGIDLASAAIRPSIVAPGETAQVELIWQIRQTPGVALTTFVHVGDPSAPPLLQGDNTPLGGHYPTTLWSTGEVFSDSYTLAVPPDMVPGLYPVHIGLYRPEDGSRLPLTVDGDRQANDAYLAGWLEVK